MIINKGVVTSGRVQVSQDDSAIAFQNGLGYTADALLVTTEDPESTDGVISGVKVRSDGAVRVFDASSSDPDRVFKRGAFSVTAEGQLCVNTSPVDAAFSIGGINLNADGYLHIDGLGQALFLKTYESGLNATLRTQFNLPPQDSNGWSVFTPSADSRVMYVNTATGDDTVAASSGVYTYGDGSAFTDWFSDEGQVAFATFNAAYANMRAGESDYIICRNGQVFSMPTNNLRVKSGKSATERNMVMTYGAGNRAVLNCTAPGGGTIFSLETADEYFGCVGLKLTDTRRDVNHPDFIGDLLDFDSTGFNMNAFGSTIKGILIEDCWFSYITSVGTTALYLIGTLKDIIIRRNVITDNYPDTTANKSQGMFLNRGSYLIEENFFDHNGWIEGYPAFELEPNLNAFNHNLYAVNLDSTIIEKNVFVRPSSMGVKLTSNTEDFTTSAILDGPVTNITVRETLPDSVPTSGTFEVHNGESDASPVMVTFTNRVGSEFTVSADFTGNPKPFKSLIKYDFKFVNSFDLDINKNLFVTCEIGVSYGGNDTSDGVNPRWKNINVQGNVLTETGSANQSNRNFGWGLTGFDNLDTTTSENLSLYTTNPAITDVQATIMGSVQSNTEQFNNISTQGTFDLDASINYSNADSLLSEDFVNDGADILSYLTSIGETATYENYSALIRAQSKSNWDDRITAESINTYLRQQYALVNNIKLLSDISDIGVYDGQTADLTPNSIANTRQTFQWYLAADDSLMDGETGYKLTVSPENTPTGYYRIATDEFGNTVTTSTAIVTKSTATNNLTDTEDFTSGAWIKDLVTVTANQAISPDGTMTADLITGSATNGEQRVRQSVTATGEAEVVSIYVKPVTGRYFGFRANDNGTIVNMSFDLQEGVIATEGGNLTAFIEPAAEGYYRIGVIYPIRGGASLNFNIFEDPNDYTIAADGLSYYIWGAQLSDGSAIPPYVPG